MKRPSDFSSPIFIELERIFLYRDYCLALLYICFRYLFFSNFEFFFVPKHLMQMMKKLPLESCPFKKKCKKYVVAFLGVGALLRIASQTRNLQLPYVSNSFHFRCSSKKKKDFHPFIAIVA